MRNIINPPILAMILYGISTEIFGFRERFQISREISGKVYEISVSGGPLAFTHSFFSKFPLVAKRQRITCIRFYEVCPGASDALLIYLD